MRPGRSKIEFRAMLHGGLIVGTVVLFFSAQQLGFKLPRSAYLLSLLAGVAGIEAALYFSPRRSPSTATPDMNAVTQAIADVGTNVQRAIADSNQQIVGAIADSNERQLAELGRLFYQVNPPCGDSPISPAEQTEALLGAIADAEQVEIDPSGTDLFADAWTDHANSAASWNGF